MVFYSLYRFNTRSLLEGKITKVSIEGKNSYYPPLTSNLIPRFQCQFKMPYLHYFPSFEFWFDYNVFLCAENSWNTVFPGLYCSLDVKHQVTNQLIIDQSLIRYKRVNGSKVPYIRDQFFFLYPYSMHIGKKSELLIARYKPSREMCDNLDSLHFIYICYVTCDSLYFWTWSEKVGSATAYILIQFESNVLTI